MALVLFKANLQPNQPNRSRLVDVDVIFKAQDEADADRMMSDFVTNVFIAQGKDVVVNSVYRLTNQGAA